MQLKPEPAQPFFLSGEPASEALPQAETDGFRLKVLPVSQVSAEVSADRKSSRPRRQLKTIKLSKKQAKIEKKL